MLILALVTLVLKGPFDSAVLLRWTVVSVIAAGVMFNDSSSIASAEDRHGASQANLLHREGTTITGVAGQITRSGPRWLFTVGGQKKSYRLLENLALQRIVRSMTTDPTDRQWTLDGTYTEFGSDNFIMIRRAVRTSKKPIESTSAEVAASGV